ncbi:anthranilate phosphoribosyltransferase [Kordiimonas sediminis]|uniref:Anthranilate phosphoribosyltransferase n=1 Tax=Kordiimonas sediminis TaxID=1735581 RepID=A0A919E9W6_9PROT|nr:anthranilate phosphoribosyltransferase [Kordiimonas sediminis]GHF28418.1 anthranilate phosphoribosyltransferase [Kordiimonas sediminis]
MIGIRDLLAKLAEGETLSRDDARDAFEQIMSGTADLAQMAAFIMALRVRGEVVDEIVGGADVLRSKAEQIHGPAGMIDTCGTGGDAHGTYNISTAAAFVAATGGVPVAKHGNRSVSSKSGSADVLMALGANLELDKAANEQSLKENNFAFLFAPAHHKAMRHVAPARASLKLRTIFNLLGPLANPALAKRQILGVFDRKWLHPMAEVLHKLGSEHVWVVHGADGLDEISTTSETYVVELKDGAIQEFVIKPEDFNISRSDMANLKGGDAEENAQAIRALVDNKPSAYRDIVSLNAGAALYVGGKAADVAEGYKLAVNLIETGAVKDTLTKWIAFTQQHSSEGKS